MITSDPEILRQSIADSAILVNGTSVGMAPKTDNTIITDTTMFHKDLFVFDVIYNPQETRLLREARAAGCKTSNGMYMLLYQGAASFELWTGQQMPVEIIKEKYFYKIGFEERHTASRYLVMRNAVCRFSSFINLYAHKSAPPAHSSAPSYQSASPLRSFIPDSSARSLSSVNAFAVIATIGMPAFFLSENRRIARVALVAVHDRHPDIHQESNHNNLPALFAAFPGRQPRHLPVRPKAPRGSKFDGNFGVQIIILRKKNPAAG